MAYKGSKIRKLKNIFIRAIVVVVAWYALWYQLRHHENLFDLSKQFLAGFYQKGSIATISLIILLMCLNWSLEAFKWSYLIRKSEKISFFRSLKGIMTGISVGTFTPNRLGEFLGRSFVLDKTHPWKVFFMTIIGSYSQLLATIIFGTAGLFFFIRQYSEISTGFLYIDILIGFFAIATVVFLILLYFNISILDKLIGPWLRRKKPGFGSWFQVISTYNSTELFVVLIFSLSRYIVFSFQFYILLLFFNLNFPFWNAMSIIGVVYLVMTIIPSVALSEIGVRGSVAIYFFSFCFGSLTGVSDPELGVVSTSSLLWLVNIVLPAIMGTLFVYHLRVFRNNKNQG